MRAVIFGNGDINDYERVSRYIRSGDLIICADGGQRHASALGIEPDVVIGDFDSSEKPKGNVMAYPVRKDFTDGELCVRYANGRGCGEVLLLGMTGSRYDHMLSNILMLRQCEKGYMADDSNEIYYLKNELELNGKKGMTLSIIPVKGDLSGIVTSGLEYPLRGETLFFGESRGNSNVITEDRCRISVSAGEGVVIVNNGE